MAQYYNISIEEMDNFLTPQGFQKIQLPGTIELVYGKRVDKNNMPMTLRVYTGIDPSGQSRDVGEDAMRVNLFTKLPTGEIRKLFGSKRVHRVTGWMKNLQARINDALQQIPSKMCKKCGLPMVLRQGIGKNNKPYSFYGCAGYPSCSNTEYAAIECSDSPTGKHKFTKDLEYDPTGKTINCQYCGSGKK